MNPSPFPDAEADHNEGPGLLLSGAFYVLGFLAAVGFWTLIAFGLDAAF